MSGVSFDPMAANLSLHKLAAALVFLLSGQLALSQGTKTDTKEKPPQVAVKDVKVHPWTANRRELKIDPKTKGIFDEHRVSVTAGKQTRIRISGKMKHAGGNLEGSPVLHLGKIALVPISERSGSIKVGEPSATDNSNYLILLEGADEKLKTEILELKKNVNYNWSVVKSDGKIVYTVVSDGEKKWSLTASEKDVRSFGIGAWTRFEDQKTEIDFTID